MLSYFSSTLALLFYRPVPLHIKNIKIVLLLIWLAQNFSQSLTRASTIRHPAADIHDKFL